MTENRTARIAVAVTVLISCVAMAVSIWALVRSSSGEDPSYSSDQRSEARTALCAAYDLALRGVRLQTNATAPSDRAGAVAADASARLALAVGSQTITAAVDEHPAAPDDVRSPATQLADAYRTVAANYLAGVASDSPAVTVSLQQADSAANALATACR